MGMPIKVLFLSYWRELHSYLTQKLGNTETAADLTQETFLRIAEYSDNNPAAVINHQRAYLYRTAYNLAADHLDRHRHEKTSPLSDNELAMVADHSPSPEQVVGSRDELALVRAAVLELPRRTQRIFELTRLEGLTYREAARRLNLSESTVQKHLAKATEHVMQRLRAP
jgi:RNA polymerase sigma-70 factor (ECF subfamily)